MMVNKAKPTLVMNNATVTVNTSGMVGYWRFENESLGTATDYSGYGNDGTLTSMNNSGNETSGPTVDGRFGNAMKFDGVDDYVGVANLPSLNPTQITMEMWIKFNTIPYNTQIVLNKEGQYRLIAADVDTTHLSIRYATTVTSWSAGTLIGNTTLTAGVWYHVAATYDGSSWKLYLNGNLDGQKAESGNIVSGTGSLYIGTFAPGTYHFNGTLDEVQIRNRSLSADEVNELYQSTKPYGQATTFTLSEQNSGDTDVGYSLFWNTTNVTTTHNGAAVQLPAGYHYYLANTSGGQNYTRSALLVPVNITPATPTITLKLDGSSAASQTRTYPNATAFIITEGNSVDSGCAYDIKENGTSQASANYSKTLAARAYNLTGYTAGCANYTAGQTEITLTVNKATVGVQVSPLTQAITYGATLNQNCTNNVTLGACSLWRGTASPPNVNITMLNNTNDVLSAGTWYFNATYSGSENYSAATTAIQTITVNTAGISLALAPTTQTITYGDSRLQYCADNSTVAAYHCGLYMNDSNVTAQNNTSPVLTVAAYAFKANISAPLANYTWSAQTSVLTVSISNAASVSVLLTNNDTTYGTQTTAQCVQNVGDAGTTLTLFRNGSQVAQGTTPIQEQTVLAAGFWNYTCVYPGSLNYNAYANASWMMVNKATPTFTTSVTSPITYGTASSYTGSESNAVDTDCVYKLWRNNTLLATASSVGDTTVLAARAYNYTYNTSGCTNFTAAKDEKTLVVNKATTAMNLLLNGTDADKTYAYGELANITASMSIAGTPVKINTNFTGSNSLLGSGNSPLADLAYLNYASGIYNVTGYFEGGENYSTSFETHYINLGIRLTFNVTSASSSVQQLANVKFYTMEAGKSYTDFSYQKMYGITSSTQPTLSYVFTQKDISEKRDLRFEVPTAMGLMIVDMYNVTPNTTANAVIPIRLIDGKDYAGVSPITGELSYIFFINDTALNYSSYNIKIPFNRSRMTQPNKFLRCLQFDWDSNICAEWNVTDTSSITDSGSNYTFVNKTQSLKCSPALADTGMHGSSYYEMYGGMTTQFNMTYFDDFEYGYGGWYADAATSAYLYPSDSYSGSSTSGYSLKVEYMGGGGGSQTYCENYAVQSLCTPYQNSTYYGCRSDWYESPADEETARAQANSSFESSCDTCCGGSGTFAPYSGSPYQEWNSGQTQYSYHAYGECICGSGSLAGYVTKDVNYNSKDNKYVTFSYKLPSSSAMSFRIYVSNWAGGRWVIYNGTSNQGNFSMPGFKADGMWHTATINVQKDLDNITSCSSAPCDHIITKIGVGSESGAPGQGFFMDDFMVTNEMGSASKTLYEASFENYCQINEWYGGQQEYQGYYSAYSLKIPTATYVNHYMEYFSQDYRYIDFVYKTYQSSSFKLIIRNDKPDGSGYYTVWNQTEITIPASVSAWTKKHIDLAAYGLGNTKVKKVEFYGQSGASIVDDFSISNEMPGVCTDCNISYGGVQFNTLYFSDFEYGLGGWVAAGGSTMGINTTNATSYSGMRSLVMGNHSNLVANFTPGYAQPSVPVSSYPYMSFAYKAYGGTLKYKIGSTWYNIPGFVADGTWRNVTISLSGYGSPITEIALGNPSAGGATFHIDDFSITSRPLSDCPYTDARQDITFQMSTMAGWRIDAASGGAKPDLYIVSYTFNNTTAIHYNDFISVNVTVGNIGNSSTGGGNDAIQVDLYLDGVLQSTNYTHELPAHPPRNESFVWVNFTAPGAGLHMVNITSMLNPPPGKEEWNYTNNNVSMWIVVYSNTKITPVLVNTSTPVRGSGQGSGLSTYARLLFTNNSAVPDQNLTFTDTSTSTYMGFGFTNSSGYANLSYEFPADTALGPHTINVTYASNDTSYTYGIYNDSVSVDVYSLANVSFLTASDQLVHGGDTFRLEAIAKDAINGSVISGYPCNFYDNATLLGTSSTNSTGHCLYLWSPTSASWGYHVAQVNITVNPTLYYFGKSPENVSSIGVVVNAKPSVTVPAYNVAPAEIERGNGIVVSCDVSDAEDAIDLLTVNISVRDAGGVWSNATITDRYGSTFYRDYQTTQNSTLGNYTALCTAIDTDGGRTDNSSVFLVWQNGTVSVNLNATSVAYGAAINASGRVAYLNGDAVTSSDVVVSILGEQKCIDTTDAAGGYACVFSAPNRVGTFMVDVQVIDKDTGKRLTNSTALAVSVSYGEPTAAESAAKDVGCYEVPSLVQNADGSITKSTVRICVWK
jgi:hypothetical protein